MSDSVSAPSYLPVLLYRDRASQAQLGCTGVLALLLLGLGYLCYLAAGNPAEKTRWVGWVVGGGFGFFGLLLAWSFIRLLAAVGIKETIVQVSEEPLQPGQSARVCIIQPGPAKLKSLRANLVCTEKKRYKVRNSKTKKDEWHEAERMLQSINVMDAPHMRIPAGDFWHEIHEFSLPSDAPIFGTTGDVTITWKFEVWGRGYFLASFTHAYLVDVFHGQRPASEDDDEEDDDEDESESESEEPLDRRDS